MYSPVFALAHAQSASRSPENAAGSRFSLHSPTAAELRACFFCPRQRKLVIPPACADMIRILPLCKKEDHPTGGLLFWQRRKDSNPHKRSQSPVCYLYTTPLNARDIIHDFRDLSSAKLHFLCCCRYYSSRSEFPK